jgi:hypothetical protein
MALDDVVMVLVGNKSDLAESDRVVKKEDVSAMFQLSMCETLHYPYSNLLFFLNQAEAYATKHQMLFGEVSAR